MEKALAAIHQANHKCLPFRLEYASQGGRVALFVECASVIESIVLAPIIANYPNCSLTTSEARDPCPPGWQTWAARLQLVPEIYPILRHAQFEDLLNGAFADPINGILRAIQPEDSLLSRIEIVAVPAGPRRCRRAAKAVKRLDRAFFRSHHELARYYAEHITRGWGRLPASILGLLAPQPPSPHHSAIDTSAGRLHDREDDLQAASDKIGGHLFDTSIRLVVCAPPQHARLALARLRQMAGAFGAFSAARLARFRLYQDGRRKRAAAWEFLLSHEELATLFHPPTMMVAAERMQMQEFTELEAPAFIYAGKEEGAVPLGRVRFRTDERFVGIGREDRLRHVYVVGSTGAGKSTLLLNQIHADMESGRGLTVFDVHGDLADAVVRLAPRRRTNDVIVFNAAASYVVPFNPLACPDLAHVDQVASGVVSAMRKLYDSWGPRLENLLRSAVFAAVEQSGTLLTMHRLLTEEGYRDHAVPRIQDAVVRAFWEHEFAGWSKQYRTEAVSSVTNKILPLLTNRQLRAIMVPEGGKSLDLRDVMDREQVLIVNLSRGRLGQDNATLLGSLLLTSLEQAALTRAELPESERKDHYLYLDEFQSLTTPSTAIILSEARKYRLGLTLSHQLTRQLDERTLSAVLGNCGSLVAFRVGFEDAALLAPAFSKFPGQLKPEDLTNLSNYSAYVRLLTEGVPTNPFSINTLPPPAVDDDRQEIVYRTSQRRHARPVASVARDRLSGAVETGAGEAPARPHSSRGFTGA
ncbi:MAG TPA: type IV secretion system DNA-binding domain-containing protein [Pirellulales bacterium]|nr:type IV secretion system DNA-binding domain-containing protein [Pirellulales bacterium]